MQDNYSSFEQELSTSGKLVYTNVGVSMLPLLHEGRDVMLVESRKVPLKKYDVVLFRRDNITGRGRYVVHRIIKILPGGRYFIVGDNCTEGETVEDKNVLGVLTSVMRDGKNVDFNSLRYKLYVYLWCAPYRFRFFLLKAKRGIKYLFSAVKHKIFGK